MKLQIFRSLSGDCVLLTSPGGKRILADGGMPDAYTDHIATPLGALRKADIELDVLYVSHIDRDHIGGVLRMLDIETEWRVFDHMTDKGKTWSKPKSVRPPIARKIWHNAFFDTIQQTKAVNLGTAGLSQILNSAATTLSAANNTAGAAYARLLALSVGDAIAVNWRIGDGQLGIPLNPEYDGGFMVRGGDQISIGDLTITVISPSAKELRELKKTWIDWLQDNQKELSRLRRQQKRDIDRLDSSSADQVVDLARTLALRVEPDVTPPNLASLVLLVECDGRRILLSGDAGDLTILEALEEAGLMDDDGGIDLDVLKVPHHGAHNSFSEDFVRRVRAKHYIFCGDGEHDNPEHDVVDGYIAAPGSFKLWFNCSSDVALPKHLKHWRTLEKMAADAPSRVKSRFLRSGASLTLNLA